MNQKEIGSSPFDKLLTRFLRFLENEKSYKKSTLNDYRARLHKMKLYMLTNGIDFYTPDFGIKYYEIYISEHNITIPAQKSVFTFINRLNAFYSGEEYTIQRSETIELLPDDYELVLNTYFLKCYENGNKERTIEKKNYFLRGLLNDCIDLGCTSIQELNASHVTRACLRVKNKDSWAVMRDFLKFLAISGTTEADLSLLVPYYKQVFKVPVTYSVDEISKVVDVIDRFTTIGKRDFAIMLIVTRLGMRAGDIVNLTLEDLTHANDKLYFSQQKTGEGHELPLLPEIKNALEDYINNGRPETLDSRVFIRQCAPYEGIGTSALHYATTKYFHAAGIDTTGKKHGPHAFRSSMASSMVNDAIPYEAVRKILGHSDPNAIKHYAKLNVEMLRQCAIAVPEPSGKFKEFLQGGGLQ